MAKNFKRNMEMTLLQVIILLGLCAGGLYVAVSALDKVGEEDVVSNQRIGIVTTLKTRFMAIYSGPEVNGVQHGGSGVSATKFHTPQHPAVTGNSGYTVSQPSMSVGTGNSGSMTLPTQSSQSLHAYGGGGGAGATGGSSSAGSSVSSGASYGGGGIAALPSSARSTSSARTPAIDKETGLATMQEATMPGTQSAAAAGPRRIAMDDDDDEETSKAEEDIVPMGNGLWALLLMAALLVAFRLRRREA